MEIKSKVKKNADAYRRKSNVQLEEISESKDPEAKRTSKLEPLDLNTVSQNLQLRFQ